MTFSPYARRRQLVGLVVALLVLAVTSYAVARHPGAVDRFDLRLGDPLASLTDDYAWVDQVARALSSAFRNLPIAIYAAVLAGILVWKRHPRPALWTLGVIAVTITLTTALKAVFARPRPDYANMQLLDGAFPSGHSSGTAALAGCGVVLAFLFLRRSNQRRAVVVSGLLLTLLLGLDRLLLGVHGVTDVTAGYALGAAVVLGAMLLVDPTPRAKPVEPLQSAFPGTREVLVILNPVKIENAEAFRHMLDARALELGWNPPVWVETTIEDPGHSMARRAIESGADLVVVCGGDGTVRTVCGELAGSGIPVGVVPAGTGNLLARNLDLPLYLNAAIEVALNGQDRAIDLVRIEGDGLGEREHFLVMAGMGLDAALMSGVNERVKAKVGWLAYFVSGVRNIMFPAVRLEISLDDGPVTRHWARTVVVGNVGFLQAGLPLLPDATLDDGRIDVVIINPVRFLHWFRVVTRVLTRGKKLDDTVNRMTGRSVTIRAGTETPRQIDGDAIDPGRELIATVLHGRLLVRAPR
jgi:diacylglycerol kinase family enzyme/membrane-associated phospholipid phosphatase